MAMTMTNEEKDNIRYTLWQAWGREEKAFEIAFNAVGLSIGIEKFGGELSCSETVARLRYGITLPQDVLCTVNIELQNLELQIDIFIAAFRILATAQQYCAHTNGIWAPEIEACQTLQKIVKRILVEYFRIPETIFSNFYGLDD